MDVLPKYHKQVRRFCRLLKWSGIGGTIALLVLIGVGGYFWFTTPLPTDEQLRAATATGNTRILDSQGRLLYQIPDPFSGQHHPLALAEIPLSLQQATIATEDSRFYDNAGIDPRGILRAAWLNLRSGEIVAGGSTITQQLVRNFLLDPQLMQQRTWERKARETVLALKLNTVYEKDDILALYLNQTYYGGLAYGVEAASQHFFGKPAHQLSLAEAALLAGLPQAPSYYDPLQGDMDAAKARQADVLDAMVRSGYITAKQAETTKAEPLQFATETTAMRAPHFVGYVINQLEANLGPDIVARGGLTITTTLDLNLQNAAQSTLRQHIDALSASRSDKPDHRVRNGAVVVLDSQSGAILAMVGSPDFTNATIQGQVNGALAPRQPGSTLKPLTYAAALEGGWTPATTILDVPSTFQTREGRPYTPQNYDRTFHGPLSLREALATSSNVAAVQTLDEIGIPTLLEMATRLGMNSLGHDGGRYGLSLTLGGGEVTLLELSSAYAAFANQGYKTEPLAITAITDAQGKSITGWNNQTNSTEPTQALSPQIAYLITDILADRYARMRSFGENSPLDVDRPAAAKTGTTTDWRDNWTIGYSPNRVVGVWVGNANGEPMESISGITGAGPIWHEVMLTAHRDMALQNFESPSDIVEVDICAQGGLLPGPHCPSTRRERFITGTQPTQSDNTHIQVTIDPERNCRAPDGYPSERSITRVFRILPPEAEAWSISEGVPQVPRQICPMIAQESEKDTQTASPQPESVHTSSEPVLLTPASGAVFTLSPGVPAEHQQIALQAQAGRQANSITFYVNSKPVATLSRAPYRVLWQLELGEHTAYIEIEDEDGNIRRSDTVSFRVTEQRAMP
ncbi:MAG: penicillin-binding protein 1C [Chloroflexota bacterium]